MIYGKIKARTMAAVFPILSGAFQDTPLLMASDVVSGLTRGTYEKMMGSVGYNLFVCPFLPLRVIFTLRMNHACESRRRTFITPREACVIHAFIFSKKLLSFF